MPTVKKIRENYERYRATHDVRESVVLVADDYQITRSKACWLLGLDEKYSKPKNGDPVEGAISHPAFMTPHEKDLMLEALEAYKCRTQAPLMLRELIKKVRAI